MVLKYKQFFERLVLANYDEYIKLVGESYKNAEPFNKSEVYRWKSLNEHNHKMFKRLLSKVDVVFCTNSGDFESIIEIDGKGYKVIHVEGDNLYGLYDSYEDMVRDVNENKTLKISIDHSEHPVFSVTDNIIFRAVHDYIVHILSGVDFSGKGEIAAFNAHAKMLPSSSRPALFTEVVGQACYYLTYGEFSPVQKITILSEFDFVDVGVVNGYNIVNKKLIKSNV
jgi:hypothetical protein